MPRWSCEQCHADCKRSGVAYTLYLEDGTKARSRFALTKHKTMVCQRCAERALKRGVVFNLRRIHNTTFGNSRVDLSIDYGE